MASDPGAATTIRQLRIALSGLSPPVWRRVLVPEHLTLGQLHNVIQLI
ncbi:IS1096 element passenger TnpR family protein [Cupriavidus basilensis]